MNANDSLRIVLDTDIGTDIDDAYALLLAATAPELDLRAVTTVNSDVVLRAKIAKKLLRLLGRDDVPVAPGAGPSLTPGEEKRGWDGREGRGIDLTDIEPDRDFAPVSTTELLASAIRECQAKGRQLTFVTIGPLTNAGIAVESLPRDLLRGIGRIVAMASNCEGYGEGCARGEHNVACDPIALDRVLRSGIPVTLIGLNVTHQTWMAEDQLRAIESRGGELARALSGMHRSWFEIIKRDRSPMHDPLAVAVAFRPDLVKLEPVVAEVRPSARPAGTVVYNAPRPGEVTHVQIATAVDVDAFHRLFEERMLTAVGRDA